MLSPGDLDHLNRQFVATAAYLVKRGEKLTTPVVTTAIVLYALVGLAWLAGI